MKITGTYIQSTLGSVTGNENTNTEVNDSLGNKVTVPAGFKVVNPSDTVLDGIIIEDVSAGDSVSKGNQFVWIPVGKINTPDGIEEIKLARYDFYMKGEDGNYPEMGTDEYKEETASEHAASGYKNAIAKDINQFINNTNQKGGYYLGRFEAGNQDDRVVSKKGVPVYNMIPQNDASDNAQNMYDKTDYTSDLVNSYAWDTAIIFIEKFGENKNYATQNGSNTQGSLVSTGESILSDTGKEDVQCNIYDMAGNLHELETETCCIEGLGSYTNRGGRYNTEEYASNRSGGNMAGGYNWGFRVIIYL